MKNLINKSRYKLILEIIKMYKWQNFSIICLTFIILGLNICSPLLTMKIINIVSEKREIKELIYYIILFAIVVIFQQISVITSYIKTNTVMKTINKLKTKLMYKFYELDGSYFSENNVGNLMMTVNSDTSTIGHLATNIAYVGINSIFTAITSIIFLGYLKLDLLIIICMLQPLTILAQHILSNKIEIVSELLRVRAGESYEVCNEFFSNSHQLVSCGAKEIFIGKYQNKLKNLLHHFVKQDIIMNVGSSILEIISYLNFVIIIGYGGYQVIKGDMTMGALVAFISYSNNLMRPIMEFGQLYMDIKSSGPSLDRINKILDLETKNKGDLKPSIKGNIKIKDVTHSYEDGKIIFDKINLNFKKGRKHALVGKSGAGKSSIVRLITRLWDCKEGTITIDGINIEDIELEYLRKNIAVVSQDAFILNDSIFNNIVFGNDKVTKEALDDVLKLSGIYDDIMSMPEKLDTVVGDNGVKISGGQKQRIAIARALLKDSPIVIFDEPTSSLDMDTEKVIKETIKTQFKNKTLILITHRMELAMECDIIYEVSNGKVSQLSEVN